MRIKSLFALIVLMFSLGAWTEAAKGGSKNTGGGRGKPSSNEPPAEFHFPVINGLILPNGDLDAPWLTGEGINDVDESLFTIYENRSAAYPGVEAYFMGSGNPRLTLDDPVRKLIVRFDDSTLDSCGVDGQTFYANGDSLWFSQLANLVDWRDSDDPTEVDPDYQTIDGRFLGMTGNISEGYSMMILRFILPDESGKDFLWTAVFGDFPAATNPDTRKTRVKVSVTVRDSTTGSPLTWHIEGIDSDSGTSIARVRSQNLKGKTVSQDLGLLPNLDRFRHQSAAIAL